MGKNKQELVGQGPAQPVFLIPFRPLGEHQTLALGVDEHTLANEGAGARFILMQAIDQDIRYTLDTSAPTTSHGFRMNADDPERLIPITSDTTIRVIGEAAGAILEYQWGT